MKWTVVSLRLGFGLILLGVAGWFGFAHRNPWVIVPLSMAFTVLYIAGKWYAWRTLWTTGGAKAWGKALPPTLAIQCVIAGIVYLIGLGLGRLLAARPMALSMTLNDVLLVLGLTVLGLLVSAAVNRLEGGKGPVHHMAEMLQAQTQTQSSEGTAQAQQTSNADFEILPDAVTYQTLFANDRVRVNYTQRALLSITDSRGARPLHIPKAANDLAIEAAEARIGFALPDALRDLYKVKDGGPVKGRLMLPKVPEPHPVYDDWIPAFGGYDTLYGLSELRTVHDSILDFASEDDTDMFPDGAEQMLILAQYYQETTFLDYRQEGPPRVGLANFDDADWEDKALFFEDFEDFFASLVCIEERETATIPRPLTNAGPPAAHPDGFWIYQAAYSNYPTADHGADEALWSETEQRLGVSLPAELKPYLGAVNGGMPCFNTLPEIRGTAEQPGGLEPFPGGVLLGIHRWITLETLSDRLEFQFDIPPWTEIWPNSDRLIVISAHFNAALMLDYRFEDTPTVLYAPALDTPDQAERLGPVSYFLSSLRAIRDPYDSGAPIGDIRLSVRAPSAAQFWQTGTGSGLTESAIQAHEARLDTPIASNLKAWMQVQDGGTARYRYLPPLRPNAHGHLNYVPTSGEWVDVFPDGINPMAEWQTLTQWLRETPETLGDALRQKSTSQFAQQDYGDPAKILVLAKGPDRLTLLDGSRGRGAEDATIVLVQKSAAGWTEQYRSKVMRAMRPAAKREAL